MSAAGRNKRRSLPPSEHAPAAKSQKRRWLGLGAAAAAKPGEGPSTAPAAKPAKPAKPRETDEQRAARRARWAHRASYALSVARAVLGVCLALGLAGGLALSARSYALHSARFSVRSIEVHGNERLSAQQLREVAEVTEGLNIFSLRADEARLRLLSLPWIEAAEVRRSLPDAVRISVTERKAAALISLGQTMLATRDGEVFKALELGDPTDLPVITCMDEEKIAEDAEGAKATIREALDLLTDYAGTKVGAKLPAEELCVRKDGSFALVIGKEGLSLRLGRAPYRRKLAQAERVIYELERRRAKADVILLDNEARPDRVVVRVR